MLQQNIQAEPPIGVNAPEKFVFQNYQKAGLLILLMAILYLRLTLRKSKKDRICPHCNRRNPPHRSNCTACSAPLMQTTLIRSKD
ncbi:MAG: zinc finger Ran-binding domain-containing protein [Holophagales bacterium]|jgi:hypothetical protein|nr:zinc finger Ran-binding domain-containing protein [Holophagales bacterium]